VFEAKAKKQKPLAIFIEQSKAFDCVNHSVLLSFLWKYGARGTPFDLLKSYLFNRKQYVKTMSMNKGQVETPFSAMRDILFNVPQGSNIGPYLFYIYTNCIQKFVSDLGGEATSCLPTRPGRLCAGPGTVVWQP